MAVDLGAIGISGILAAEAQLQAIEANIANANNPAHSRESVVLRARSGADGSSIGVDVLGIRRAEAPLLARTIDRTGAAGSFSSAFARIARTAESFLSATGGKDLATTVQELFNSFENLAASPEDAALRGNVLAAAGSFSNLTEGLSNALDRTAAEGLQQLTALIQQVNDDSRQIAGLNARIVSAQARGDGAPALLDQRDALVTDLASLIGARDNASGNVSVAGLPLVSGSTPLELSVSGTGAQVTVQVQLPNGELQVPPDRLSGTIGGIIAGAARVTALRDSLDGFATALAEAINTVHASGFGLDGSSGNALFLIPAGGGPIALNPAVTMQSLAAAASASGVPGDGSNATAIAALAGAAGIDGSFPASTPAEAFGAIAADFGSALRSVVSDGDQAAASLESLNRLKGSITGVSLNEELTRLIQFQNALQAAGRALQVVNDLASFLIRELGR